MDETTESTRRFDELSKAIARTIEEHLAKSKGITSWPQDLKHPVLRVDAFLEDQGSDPDQGENPARPVRLASVRTLLDFATPPITFLFQCLIVRNHRICLGKVATLMLFHILMLLHQLMVAYVRVDVLLGRSILFIYSQKT